MPVALSHPPATLAVERRSLPAILASKLVAPYPGGQHLLRQRLLARIEQAEGKPLVVLRAAASVGKTSLLAQYQLHCQEAGRATLWLSLDHEDNALPRLLAHLAHGLQPLTQARPTADATALLELLEHLQTPLWLFLDDLQVIQAPEVLDFLQHLPGHLPAGSQLLIASRTTPLLGIGKRRAQGQLLEFSASELRFSLEEATVFLRETCGLPLALEQIATLHQRTEGWVTAHYLASVWLREHPDSARFIEHFSGNHALLAEYLAEDLFLQQSSDHQRFLLDTCVLEHFDAELARVLSGRADSPACIEHLLRGNLLLDAGDGGVRFHRLFADFLQGELERRQPGATQQQRRLAAAWYLQQKRPATAIEQLLDARLDEQALTILHGHLETFIAQGCTSQLLDWLARIDPLHLQAYPQVRLVHAWCLALQLRFRDAWTMLEQTRNAAGSVDEALHQLRWGAVHCVLLLRTDRIDECRRQARRLLVSTPPEEHLLQGLLAANLACCSVISGHHAAARRLLARTIAGCWEQTPTLPVSQARCVEAALDLCQGRLHHVLAQLSSAIAQPGWPDATKEPAGRPALRILLASALYESDALAAAAEQLEVALPCATDSCAPDTLIAGHVLMARLHWLQGARGAWERTLGTLEQIAQRAGSERMMCSAWLERARVATLEGQLASAEQALALADLHSAWDSPALQFHGNDADTPGITRIRLEIARGRPAHAMQQLQPALRLAHRYRQRRRLLKLQLLQALALEAQGLRQNALETLDEALCQVSAEPLYRSFLDEGPALCALLRYWAQSRTCSSVAQPLVEALLRRCTPTDTEVPQESLTAREIQVIRLLAPGHRNRIIAQKLFLSEYTIKAHLRSINAKLGARGRTEAVAIARARGLLD